ncbi:hypothetical protein ACRAWF_19275 [Streptomyces sp. L7]
MARAKTAAAARVSGAACSPHHVADYRRLYDRFSIDLGRSSTVQRSLDSVVAHRRQTHRRLHPGPGAGGRLRPGTAAT